MGGFVGQQVLTSLTGKFKPVQQWVRFVCTFLEYLLIYLFNSSFSMLTN